MRLIIMMLSALLIAGLSACGQKGPLMLPTDQSNRQSKAVYLIDSIKGKRDKAAGEIDPAAQQPMTAQPAERHPASIN